MNVLALIRNACNQGMPECGSCHNVKPKSKGDSAGLGWGFLCFDCIREQDMAKCTECEVYLQREELKNGLCAECRSQ